MPGIALLILILVLSRRGAGDGDARRDPLSPLPPAPAPPALPPIAKAAKQMPKPWPQAMPAGLPAFGPQGWEPDNPPPAPVQARAWQLLASLWGQGPGSIKTEQTAGRWITYQAQPMGKKKGVVAFRLRGSPPPATEQPAGYSNV